MDLRQLNDYALVTVYVCMITMISCSATQKVKDREQLSYLQVGNCRKSHTASKVVVQ